MSRGDSADNRTVCATGKDRVLELTNPKSKGRETQRHILEQLGVGPSFRTITDTKIMGKLDSIVNCSYRK